MELVKAAQRGEHLSADRPPKPTVNEPQRLQTADPAECVLLRPIHVRPGEQDLRQVGVTERVRGQDPDVAGGDVENSATQSIARSSPCFPDFSAAWFPVRHRIRPVQRPLHPAGSRRRTTWSEVNAAEREGVDVIDVDAIQNDSADVFQSLEHEPVHLGHLRVPDQHRVDALRVSENPRVQRQRWNALDDDAPHPASTVEGVRVDGQRQTAVAEYHVEVLGPGECVSLDAANVVPRKINDARTFSIVDVLCF